MSQRKDGISGVRQERLNAPPDCGDVFYSSAAKQPAVPEHRLVEAYRNLRELRMRRIDQDIASTAGRVISDSCNLLKSLVCACLFRETAAHFRETCFSLATTLGTSRTALRRKHHSSPHRLLAMAGMEFQPGSPGCDRIS
jgi:hypothetical protein